MRIGYGRVSTHNQNPDAQQDALTAAGCEQIFTGKASGKLARRPELDKALLVACRRGDQLVVTKLDRIGRSVRNLLDVSSLLQERGVDLVCLDQPIDTTSPQGKLFFTILAAFAEFERDLIRERTRDGLAATTARGRNGGRKHRLTPGQVQAARDLRAAGRSVREIGQLLGNGKPVSRQTVYRALGMLAT